MARSSKQLALTVLGAGALALAAGTANAQVDPNKGIVALNTTADAAFFVGGTVTVSVPFVHVNSGSATAVLTNGKQNEIDTKEMKVVGNVDFGPSTFTGTLTTGAAEFADPYQGLPEPAFNPAADNGHFLTDQAGYHYVSPGYYSGGITVAANSTAVFLPGIYILDGVGLEALGQSNVIADSAVFVIRGTGRAYIEGGASVIATPPSSGDYRGVSIFQVPGCSNTTNIAGDGDISVGGAIYAPTARVVITGTGAVATTHAAVGDFVIADTVEVSGRGQIAIGDAEFSVVSVFGLASWD